MDLKDFDEKFSSLGSDDRLYTKKEDGCYYSVGLEEIKSYIQSKLKEERDMWVKFVMKELYTEDTCNQINEFLNKLPD